MSGKFSVEVHRDCKYLAGPLKWALVATKAFRTVTQNFTLTLGGLTLGAREVGQEILYTEQAS